MSMQPYGPLGLCKANPKSITHSGAFPELDLCDLCDSNATKTSSENCTSIFRSASRDLARALSPHSRGY